MAQILKTFFLKLRASTAGSSLVELAMIMPILLLILVGTLDMGSMFMRKMELSNAAKAGIQYAMVRKPVQGDLTNIRNAVRSSLGTSMTPGTEVAVELYCICNNVKQLCTTDCTDENVSAFVNIEVKEDYTTPYFNYDWFISHFPIRESATIKLN
ncbi:TadE/TadG family type IV pilus assembly protein [Paremcibacter congregatus]|uniref:TadE-like domain-containing protein n=1 Tax=Paremcibacter congregatus TaxID=2043170 RepID=A0A2G4YQ14_9PROT|nr:TadE/TadG family type IV pilus assembly protein [Paremcibacter congregatus]PHZ83546.1 hypothetical protein CRD36_16405 [Paremcibacter congregatus]QDE28368.1 pilus assembly protein [Paremcibacter congregatus]